MDSVGGQLIDCFIHPSLLNFQGMPFFFFFWPGIQRGILRALVLVALDASCV